MAKLNKSSSPHYWCYAHTSDYYLLWLNLDILITESLRCFVDNMKLHYNITSRTSYNTPGVDIVVPNFGQTEPVETLSDDWLQRYTQYFRPLVNKLQTKAGYMRNKNIYGAPYDFRRAPNELGALLTNLTQLTERAFRENGNVSVTIVAHSYGCPLTLYWLQRRSQAWKNRYISRFISLAGPYAGTALSLKVYAAGYNLGVREINGHVMREEQRTSPSLAFLSPSSKLWHSSVPLLTTPDKNYSLSNIEQFFRDINTSDAWEMWKDVYGMLDIDKPPGVAIHCVVGRNVTTVEKTVYSSQASFPDSPDVTASVYGDGDGTVNFASLAWCERWRPLQSQPVTMHAFANVDHMGVLQNPPVMDFVIDQLLIKSQTTNEIR